MAPANLLMIRLSCLCRPGSEQPLVVFEVATFNWYTLHNNANKVNSMITFQIGLTGVFLWLQWFSISRDAERSICGLPNYYRTSCSGLLPTTAVSAGAAAVLFAAVPCALSYAMQTTDVHTQVNDWQQPTSRWISCSSWMRVQYCMDTLNTF